MVGTLGRRTTDRERRQGWNWNVFKKMDTLEEGWLAQCQQRYAGTTIALEATGGLSRKGLHQGE